MSDHWGFGAADRTKSWGTAIIGNAQTGRRVPLLRGEHKHSYSDNSIYADLGHAEPEAFDGHRILIDVRIAMENYLKESELSGDEVRKGGSCTILADGVPVFEFFTRDTQSALLRAHHLIGELSDHSSGWLSSADRAKLVGRKVFYRNDPASVKSLIEDQGCLILVPDGVERFAPEPWREADGDDDGYVKVEVTSRSIWWWRD